MKSCPKCGFSGTGSHCPNDGEPLQSDATMADGAIEAPTLAPPIEKTGRAHAPAAQPGEPLPEDAHMRGEDYGQWAEPTVKKKKAKDPFIGRTIGGRYEVKSLLGKGGMGAVYKCKQPAVQRMVALKVLLSEFADNETVVKRFHQEALAASRLTHPNTISVYDFGQSDDGVLYIAMEYLRGLSLAQELKASGAMSAKRAIHMMRQICKSLSEAHKAGIIHRDLKPDNIFLTDIEGERDFVKVLDFGVAKLKEYEGKEGTLTQAGMIFGTPKYMSPEQARSGQLDPRADVYALGVILYEMVCGRPPFSGENPLAVLIAHVNEQPPPFASVNPDHGCPPAFEAVVMKALSKKAEHRQDSVDTLGEELGAIDELLDGASYESVAHRLPEGAETGADPSLIGPAIMPTGELGQAPEREGGGNTVILDGGGAPLNMDTDLGIGPLSVDLDGPPEPARGGHTLGFVLAFLIPLTAAGAWYLTTRGDGPEADKTPVATASEQTVADAAQVVPSKAPDAAPAPLPKDAEVAQPEDASEPQPKPVVEVMVRSVPKGARITLYSTGDRIGVTNMPVKISEKTKLVLKRRGYENHIFEIEPGVELPPIELTRRVSRPRPPKQTPVGTVKVIKKTGPKAIGTPVTPKVDPPIELDLE